VTSEASDLLHAALALPTGDRAGVAAALLASLDETLDDATAEAAWVAELQTRADRVIAGRSAGIPRVQVRADLAGLPAISLEGPLSLDASCCRSVCTSHHV
jgi:putative addiction module component (TIGR02574 family)